MSFAAAERAATLAAFSEVGIGFSCKFRPASGSVVTTTCIIEDERATLGEPPFQAAETRTLMRLLVDVAGRAKRGDVIEIADLNERWQIETEIRRSGIEVQFVVIRA